MPLAPAEMEALQTLLRRRTGYALTTERGYLAENRLAPLARREGMSSGAQLVEQLETLRPSLSWEVVEAMLPVDSHFFRERETFRVLEALLPALAAARPGGAVRVLSAGCATDQASWPGCRWTGSTCRCARSRRPNPASTPSSRSSEGCAPAS